jgi:hypothetical protein
LCCMSSVNGALNPAFFSEGFCTLQRNVSTDLFD